MAFLLEKNTALNIHLFVLEGEAVWVYFLKLCELVGQRQVGKIGSSENGEDWQCRQDCPAAGASDFAFTLFGSVLLQK